ncbi:MAG TPA: GAF domain-containing protein, partial [Phototrophicaceae bacterium]|nr:GAF domain-containing protein [Phototrophicaceae bacterium]
IDENDHRTFNVMHSINFAPAYDGWLAKQGTQIEHSTSRTVMYNDLSLEGSDILKDEAQNGLFRSKAEIPMRSGDTPMGVLIVYYNRPHFYDASEIELLETLGGQIAAALDNAELLKVLEVYASEQAQLVHLSRTSTATLDLEQVIETVLTLLRHMLNAERVYVGLADEPRNLVQFYGIKSESAYQVKLSDLAQIHTLETMPQFYGREDASPGLAQLMTYCEDESIAAVSLVVNNEFVGLVILGTPHHFGDAETRLLELAANQIAVQIHNARQYRFVQEALERRLRQLSLLENIARQISSALNVERLISNVLDAAIQATQGDMAALALITENGDFQIIGREFVDNQWQVRSVSRSRNSGIMGRVANTRERLIVPDNQRDPDYLAFITRGRYHSSLVVPLLRDEEVIGVLDIESTQTDFFRDEHAEFIENLAGHAVISIQNAHLLQERQRQIDVLTSLRSLSLKLSSDTDRKSVIHEILQTALMVVQGESAVMYHYPEDTHRLTYAGSLRRNQTGFDTEWV